MPHFESEGSWNSEWPIMKYIYGYSVVRFRKSKTPDSKEAIIKGKKIQYIVVQEIKNLELTIIPRARMGSESIAHDAEGRMSY